MTATAGTIEFRKEMTKLRYSYEQAIRDFRRPLYYYCLSLTKDPIDAEDLNQETLLRCFARLAEIWEGIDNLRGYHFRTATNLWLNRLKSKSEKPSENIEDYRDETWKPEDRDIRDLAIIVQSVLAPNERASFMLKDVLGFSLEETSAMLETSVASVKSSISRARVKIKEIREAKQRGSTRKLRAPKAMVDSLVAALNARDLEAAVALFAKQSVGEVVGAGYEIGLDAIRNGSLGVNASFDEFVKAEAFEWRGEWFIAQWANEGNNKEVVPNAILSVETRDNMIVNVKTYYYTPFLIEECRRETDIPFQATAGFPGDKN